MTSDFTVTPEDGAPVPYRSPSDSNRSGDVVDRYTTNRLRRWFSKKHKQPGKGFTHYPDEYLYQELGLIRLPMLPQNLPWAKA